MLLIINRVGRLIYIESRGSAEKMQRSTFLRNDVSIGQCKIPAAQMDNYVAFDRLSKNRIGQPQQCSGLDVFDRSRTAHYHGRRLAGIGAPYARSR